MNGIRAEPGQHQESMASGQNQDRPGQTRTDQDSMASGQLIMVIFLC
tara:strand:+ start:316 stop:456 length:141 start_codon:yes stop_codon:yes gene_type:complete